MKISELNNALFNGREVICGARFPTPEIKGLRVSAVIHRVKDGKLDISAELYNANKNFVLIADPDLVRYAEDVV